MFYGSTGTALLQAQSGRRHACSDFWSRLRQSKRSTAFLGVCRLGATNERLAKVVKSCSKLGSKLEKTPAEAVCGMKKC